MFRARQILWLAAIPVGVVAMACSSNVAGTISLITGYQEQDPFTQAPAPTSIQITALADDGGVTVLAQSALPVTANLALPTQSTNTTAALTATGFDDAGAMVLWGQTLPIEFSSIEGLTLPMFVQRTGELTRLPSPFAAPPVAPIVTILDGRFLLSIEATTPTEDASAAAASTQIFDLLTWAPYTSAPALPVAPVALVTVGTQALLINGSNTIWYDFSDTSTSTPTLPSGFEGLTGGVTVTDPLTGDGYVVVGAGPSATASPVILYVNAAEQIAGSQSLSLASLGFPRSGAATTWVGRQLFVAGGSNMGTGVELLEPGTTMTIQPGYAPDATVGAGATALDQTHVLLAGGINPRTGKDAGARVIDVSCPASGCLAVPWNAPPIAPPLVSAQAFTIDSSHAFVVGNDASNNTHAWVLTPTSSTEIIFKVLRKGATALALPMPITIPITTPIYPVAVVGGDVTVESFPPFAP
jgi:hypothetical protein